MNDLPLKLRDIINSSEKVKMYEIVSSLENTFTTKDVCKLLQKDGVNVRITMVQTILKALTYRGYLKQFDFKIGNTRGRSTIHYQWIEPGIKL